MSKRYIFEETWHDPILVDESTGKPASFKTADEAVKAIEQVVLDELNSILDDRDQIRHQVQNRMADLFDKVIQKVIFAKLGLREGPFGDLEVESESKLIDFLGLDKMIGRLVRVKASTLKAIVESSVQRARKGHRQDGQGVAERCHRKRDIRRKPQSLLKSLSDAKSLALTRL